MNKKAIIEEKGVEYQVTYKDGKEVKRYCLSTDPAVFTPKSVNDICPEYMLRYCQAKGISDMEWYVSQLKTPIKEENNTGLTIERHPTAAEVRRQFIKKYFPAIKTLKEQGYKTQISKAEEILAAMKASTPKAAAPAKAKD